MHGPMADPKGTGDGPGAAAGRVRLDIDFEALANDLKPLSNPKRLKLLHFLTEPHYLEEIASELKMARQSAQKHVDLLMDGGFLKKQQGRRDSGPVTEYLLRPQKLFTIHEEFGKLGVLEPVVEDEMLTRTQLSSTAPAGRSVEGVPRLRVVHGRTLGQTYELSGDGPWMVGRDPKGDVTLDYDPFVSNRHAEIGREGDEFGISDAFSTNGTRLNWEALDKGQSVPLRHGDVLGVGKTLLVFHR